MSAALESRSLPSWNNSTRFWVCIGLAGLALGVAFWPGLDLLATTWNTVEEYSYGWLIGPLAAFLVWQRSDRLRALPLQGSWSGIALVALAVLLCIGGRLSLVRLLLQYGFVLAVYGVALCAIGWSGLRIIGAPLALLLLMIPLPHFVLHEISEDLQLLSSQLGVAFIRLCDISVYREGNVIDLGTFKLQVVDACSGLRYLFPLIALGFISTLFFRAPLWKRALIVLSAVPLTIGVNSLRIGFIGLTVEYWGPKMAEGMIHDFEGWFMFLVCLGLMFIEMAVLARIGAKGHSLRNSFRIDLPTPSPTSAATHTRPLPASLVAAAGLAVGLSIWTIAVPLHHETEPARQSFSGFPLSLPGDLTGRPSRLPDDVVATLQLDDYLMVDYVDAARQNVVNFYIAYYASQTGAEKASHSPKTCIPGGGWNIVDSQTVPVTVSAAKTIQANRVVIERGEQRQLVYYWFKQGSRNIADDLLIKWYIVLDSMTEGRTDGALVRIVSPVLKGDSIEAADARITTFIRATDPLIPAFVPD